MSKSPDKHPIEVLTIMLNKACNLNCDYCFINKANSCGTNKINDELLELIHSGYYQRRVCTLFTPEEREEITRLDIWGGEPTLNYAEILVVFLQLLAVCKNIREVHFSTNFALPDAAERIIAIYKGLRDINKEHKISKPFNIGMQISIDGPSDITDRNRGDDVASRILDNFKKLCELLKREYERERCDINIHTHGVVDTDTIESLTTIDGIEHFWDYFAEMDKVLCKSGLKGPRISVVPGLVFMFPTPETKETGKLAAKMYEKLYEFYAGGNEYGYSENFWDNLLGNFPGDSLLRYDVGARTRNRIGIPKYEEKLISMRNEIITHNITAEPEGRTYCGQTFGSLLIAPDNEYALCQNCFFDRYEEYTDSFAETGKTNHRFITNENANYKENSKNWIWRDEESYERFRGVVAAAYKNISNGGYFGNELLARTMIRTMAKAGVIDGIYANEKERNYAAKFVDPNINCMSILLTVTGSIFVPVMYYFPLYLNGAMPWIDKLMLIRIEKELERCRRDRR